MATEHNATSLQEPRLSEETFTGKGRRSTPGKPKFNISEIEEREYSDQEKQDPGPISAGNADPVLSVEIRLGSKPRKIRGAKGYQAGQKNEA